MAKLLYDVQRDMMFYTVVVGFRNSIEHLMVREGRLEADHLFWGFEPRRRGWTPEADDDGTAGSRVPNRPFGGAGTASIALDAPD